MIFSEALVEAYELEKATKQPRIVVSDKLRAFIMDDLSTNARRAAASLFQSNYVQKDPEDDTVFLDYLNFMPARKDNGDMLRRHRD
jgi:aminoglycoside phosphotransferase family enzyme